MYIIAIMWYILSLSCPGVHFVSPIFHGFVNESLPIWLIKNESVPLDVSVVLPTGQKGQ